MKKKILALLLGSLMVLTTACGTTSTSKSDSSPAAVASAPMAKSDIKVGFVYIGDIKDGGYTQAHDKGRLAIEAMGIKTAYQENVKEEDQACQTAILNLIDSGCNVIYTTSFGFMEPTLAVAKTHPEVKFGHATGYKTAANVSTYMGKVEEPRYLAGIAAGLKTKSNKIGYVAAMPISEVIRGINAFTLGVKSVNPTATVEVVWTNTWYDPTLEKQAAQQLLNKGCDVLAQHQDSTTTQTAAEEKGAFAVGYNTSTPTAAPKAYLTAPLFHWEKFYVNDVQSIIDGKWQSRHYWEGMASGMTSLDTLTANCADGTKDKVETAQKAILDGKLSVFAGPIKDQSGAVKVKDGEKMTDDEVWNMSWFVEGVIGTIPAAK